MACEETLSQPVRNTNAHMRGTIYRGKLRRLWR